MSGDQVMRDHAATLAVPEFDSTPFTKPVPLGDAKVAIVTSAALHLRGEGEAFGTDDTSYRTIDREARDLVLGHWSPNFDRTGFALDINVVFPIDRLEEMAADGVIGEVAERHYSFAGNQPDDVSTLRLDSGPRSAAEMIADGVAVVLLTPV